MIRSTDFADPLQPFLPDFHPCLFDRVLRLHAAADIDADAVTQLHTPSMRVSLKVLKIVSPDRVAVVYDVGLQRGLPEFLIGSASQAYIAEFVRVGRAFAS